MSEIIFPPSPKVFRTVRMPDPSKRLPPLTIHFDTGINGRPPCLLCEDQLPLSLKDSVNHANAHNLAPRCAAP